MNSLEMQVIEGLETVASCAVLACVRQELPQLDFQLVAFVVLGGRPSPMGECEETKSVLFTQMKEVLPNYCIPDHIEVLEQLPVNEHGKFLIILHQVIKRIYARLFFLQER